MSHKQYDDLKQAWVRFYTMTSDLRVSGTITKEQREMLENLVEKLVLESIIATTQLERVSPESN